MTPTRPALRSQSRAATLLVTAFAVTTLWLAPPKPAEAIPVFDFTNLVQNIVSAIQGIIEVSQQVSQLTNEATSIANEINMLQDMANQASRIGSPTWGQVQTWINGLATAAQVGNALIYDMPGIAGQIQSQFPGYTPVTDWNTQYQQWSTTTLDTMRGSLQSAGLNISDVNSVEAALSALRNANNSATGRNELAQVANSLASVQIEEMTKVRQLLALEINARTVHATHETNSKAAGEAALNQWIGTGAPVANPAASGAGFNP